MLCVCVWSQISDFFSSSKIILLSDFFFPRNCFLLIKSELTNQLQKDVLKIQTAAFQNPSSITQTQILMYWCFKSGCLLPLSYTLRNGRKPHVEPQKKESLVKKNNKHISQLVISVQLDLSMLMRPICGGDSIMCMSPLISSGYNIILHSPP